jgi:hypothetical protein
MHWDLNKIVRQFNQMNLLTVSSAVANVHILMYSHILSVALHMYSPHSAALIAAVRNSCFTVAEANEVGGAGDTPSHRVVQHFGIANIKKRYT